MRRFDAVLLDLDGTLVNSISDLTAAGNHVCALHGWPAYGPEAFKRLVGHGQMNLVRAIVAGGLGVEAAAAPEALVRQAYEEFAAFYETHKAQATAPYPGVCQALDELHAAGVRLGVLTNKDDGPARELVAQMFGGRIDAVQGRTDACAPKPDPAGAQALVARLGASPSRALMVGDSEPDMQVASAAGMASCGVTWGYRSREELLAAGAQALAASPNELVAHVLGA